MTMITSNMTWEEPIKCGVKNSQSKPQSKMKEVPWDQNQSKSIEMNKGQVLERRTWEEGWKSGGKGAKRRKSEKENFDEISRGTQSLKYWDSDVFKDS